MVRNAYASNINWRSTYFRHRHKQNTGIDVAEGTMHVLSLPKVRNSLHVLTLMTAAADELQNESPASTKSSVKICPTMFQTWTFDHHILASWLRPAECACFTTTLSFPNFHVFPGNWTKIALSSKPSAAVVLSAPMSSSNLLLSSSKC